jgi:hypothetical protein
MTQDEKGSSIIDAWVDDPAAACAAAAVGAVVGALVGAVVGSSVAKALASFRGGDEPPIRVRHGSIRIDLEDELQSRIFEPITAHRNWRIDGLPDPKRGKPDYKVLVLPGDGTCREAYGNNVQVVYSDRNWVRFLVNSKRTQINATDNLQQPFGRRLKYAASNGHIERVKVNGQVIYESGTRDDLLQIVLLDY